MDRIKYRVSGAHCSILRKRVATPFFLKTKSTGSVLLKRQQNSSWPRYRVWDSPAVNLEALPPVLCQLLVTLGDRVMCPFIGKARLGVLMFELLPLPIKPAQMCLCALSGTHSSLCHMPYGPSFAPSHLTSELSREPRNSEDQLYSR